MKIFKENKYTILSKLGKYGFILVIASYVLLSSIAVNACDPKTDPGCKPDTTIVNDKKPDTTITNGIKINSGIRNPLGNGISDIPSFIEAIINFVLIIGVPIVVLAIIYSGFLFVTAVGNSEKLKAAKKTLLYTLIGAALLLGAFVIAHAIKGTVDEIKSTT